MSLLLLALALQTPTPDCLSLGDYLQTMRQYPLQKIDLYTPDGKGAGRIVKLDFGVSPPVLELQGAAPQALNRLCLRRGDVEKSIVYRIVRIEHDFDGTACVSYEEGKPHSRLFQRVPHNRGKELQLQPYRSRDGNWARISAQSGFFQEALKFECGIQVGDAGLVALIDNPSAARGHLVIRQDSPLANDPSFLKKAEFEWNGIRYAIGSGLGIE